jgi:hypothetical protein
VRFYSDSGINRYYDNLHYEHGSLDEEGLVCQPYQSVFNVARDKFGEVCTDEYIYEDDGDESSTACVFLYSYGGPSGLQYEFFDMSMDDFDDYELVFPNVSIEISHYGPCGVCSSAEDLAAIMDPTLSIRSFICTRVGSPYKTYHDFERSVACMKKLGFTQACAELWTSNGFNNALLGCNSVCLDRLALCLPPELCPSDKTCVGFPACLDHPDPNLRLDPDFNNDDCTLEKCLDCDDKKSNEIFTLVAGRTSRRSGIITATWIDSDGNGVMEEDDLWVGLKRPCGSIANIFHSGGLISGACPAP